MPNGDILDLIPGERETVKGSTGKAGWVQQAPVPGRGGAGGEQPPAVTRGPAAGAKSAALGRPEGL